MDRLNKLFLIVFFAFLLVIMAELIYFFFYQPQFKKNQVPIPTLIPNPTLLPSPPVEPPPPSVDPEQALNDTLIDSLRKYKKGMLVSSVITNKLKGIVEEVDLSGGIRSLDNSEYKARIKIISEEKSDNYTIIYFSEEEVKNMKVVALENGKEQPIQLSDLKQGDRITLEETGDLTQYGDNLVVDYKITKL